VLVPPHGVPKTSSGKIRRAATRELYETGKLGRPDRALRWQLGRLAVAGAAGRLAQWVRTAADFAYAAWWWAALMLVAAVVWPLVVILPRRRWRHAALRLGARALFALTGIRFTTDADAAVPDRDAIIVVNHTSYLDGAAVSAAIPGPLSFVVTERFGRQFVAGTFLRRIGTVFVGGGSPGLHGAEDAALRAVRAGERLVVFPEGRLRRMPGLLSFYPGPFLVAAEASVPVVPVTLAGTRSVLRHSGQWFPRRAPIHVHIGEPIHASGTDFNAALALGQAARDAILAAGREPDLGREEIEFGILRQG
jgi:1-acyl-sn-glycerol-3-phosphate acyltransferase